MSRVARLTAIAAVVVACVSAAQAVDIQTVSVGNPGNTGENSGESEPGGAGPDRICGAVDYAYNIGKYEVTAGQYRDFLNAVDPAGSNPYGLYNSLMDSNHDGCQITWNGGSSTYDFSGRSSGTEADWADRSVNYVSWGDAARFANWLHNGQPVGQLTGDPGQDAGRTEDGSYALNGASSRDALQLIVREPDATWVIPSEDEWYKAAYHLNDGATGNYYDYPTSSDSIPVSEACSSGSNSANYYGSDFAIGFPFYRNEVGCYVSSASPYATFDQGGNVWEWNEAVIYGSRGLRGGSYGSYGSDQTAAYRVFRLPPTYEDRTTGFRVADVSEPSLDIQTVTVGNAGNTGELSGECVPDGFGPCRECGAVDYSYRIGMFEVTAGQYAQFLNAVADEDTYGLYNDSMWNEPEGCRIWRTGSSPNYSYAVTAEWADRPVNYVSWGDAARFANWLHNGQPTGAQDLTTTEDGSYFLDGAIDAALLAVVREPDATWAIPSEDEWYKAAYHRNDSATGNYWDYPTRSDTIPAVEVPPGTDLTNGSANYFVGALVDPTRYRTEVGAYDAKPSDSPYGTFDQGGNVMEWNETVLHPSFRGFRGGSFSAPDDFLRAANRYYGIPRVEDRAIGFRLSEVSSECGNGVPEYGEECDDSGIDSGDGCSSTCTIEEGWQCGGWPSVCVPEGIPAVSEWGMLTMALLVLTAGTLIGARRGAATV